MKTILLIGTIFLMLSLGKADAQVVRVPLRDYYQRIGSLGFYRENDGANFHYSPESNIFCFEANFTGSGRKSIFITDSGQNLNAHGKYGWAIYVPVGTIGYQMVTDESTLIDVGLGGPVYVGYIDQIKGYGAIVVEKHSITVYYFKNGGVESMEFETRSNHPQSAAFLKYIGSNSAVSNITIYTLAQLAKKYPRSGFISI